MDLSERKPNAELAYKVLDVIDANRQHFNMDVWAARSDEDNDDDESPEQPVTLADLTAPACGTTACFAGWAAALSGFAIDGRGYVFDHAGNFVHRSIEDFAGGLLGLNEKQTGALFFVEDDEIETEVADIFGPRPGRTDTPDEQLPGGGTRIHVKRVCNGCGEQLGDVTDAEIDRAMAGLPAEDVRGECPRCSAPTTSKEA